MPGQPQLNLPPQPPAFPPGLFVDMPNLTVSQGGVDTTIVEPGAAFDVSATLEVFGLAQALGASVPYTITYFFESFGPGPEGTLGSGTGNINTGGIPSPTYTGVNGTATEFNGTSPAKTTYTVPPGTLPSGRTWKLTAIANLPGGFFGNSTAFVEGPVIRTK